MATSRSFPKTTAKRKRQQPRELVTITTRPRPLVSIATAARPKDHLTMGMKKTMERRRRKKKNFNRGSSSVNSVTS